MKAFSIRFLTALLLILSLILTSCGSDFSSSADILPPSDTDGGELAPYEIYNGGVPSFTIPSPLVAYERYSELDGLGRCGVAEACLGPESMPADGEERDSLSGVTPSGWNQATYPDIVEGDHLYNRCHLIGFQLSAEQANEKNLITGTRYMNVDGMLPFEKLVANYIRETENHVMYRATPHYADKYDLVARGVILEALSVEDGGVGVRFCVYIYNIQPGVHINYKDGSSYVDFEKDTDKDAPSSPSHIVINTSTKKFHLPSCQNVKNMSEKNKEERDFTDELFDILENEGYEPCKVCTPTSVKQETLCILPTGECTVFLVFLTRGTAK